MKQYFDTMMNFQYDGDLKNENGYYVPKWASDAFENGTLFYEAIGDAQPELFIKTQTGNKKVNVGDIVTIVGKEIRAYDLDTFLNLE